VAGGYMGKLLFVNLTKGEIKSETPDGKFYRNFIGGYGIGARILYSRQRGGVDPLGPENTLGLITGPLTGTPAPLGCRYAAIAKSPLTGGWGDANCGGHFGPYLKFAGYDGVFIDGISEKPAYLLIDQGKAEIRDAGHLWGKNTSETEDTLQSEHGIMAKIVSIGLAGEKLNLVSCLITNKGSAAARSGLGAVMGSKKLKAVVVKGDEKVPLADSEAANRLRREEIAVLRKPVYEGLHIYGTAGHADLSAHSGDTPVRNWGGVGVIDMPDISRLHKDVVSANVESRTGCWHCPVACRAKLRAGTGDYTYPAGTFRPEYETLASFGAMCLNGNPEVIATANHLCDIYGLDTISTGTIISFAMECYENGLVTRQDTDGIELTWGNPQAIIAMTEKIAHREGFGDVLADGVKVAAERIGRGAERYAVHIGGQELGMHDPKFDFPAFAGTPSAAKYQMDATPGRHASGFGPTNFEGFFVNASGLCLHINPLVIDHEKFLTGFMKAVTGWDYSMEELLKAGERIETMRHVFTLRENDNPLKRAVHPRIVGRPPREDGPLAGVSADIEAQAYWNLGALDWDRVTTKPSKNKLLKLGLDDIAQELWPPKSNSAFVPV
jgi:aldehyde:ferredoxin oxidoreductase